MISRNLLIGLQSMHILTMRGHLIRMNGSMVILFAAEEVVRAGVLSYAPGSESKSFTCFTLRRLVRFCWLVLVSWGGFCLLCLFGLVR